MNYFKNGNVYLVVLIMYHRRFHRNENFLHIMEFIPHVSGLLIYVSHLDTSQLYFNRKL